MNALIAAALCAGVFMGADLGWLPADLRFVAKPLTTVLLMAWAWPRGEDQPLQRRWLRAGLVFSLGGDVALLWPEQGFLPGLVSFLIAHLCFIRALLARSSWALLPGPLMVYVAAANLVLGRWIWPGLPADLKLPVVVYVGVLALMAAQSAAWWREARSAPAAWAAVGGAAFLCSDTLIAWDRFAGGVPLATLWIHSLYWLSLVFMACSLPRAASR